MDQTAQQIADSNGVANAFPIEVSNNPTQWGLTKREEFAKAAMVGILSNPAFLNTLSGNTAMYVTSHVAELAIDYADALLLELAKPKQ